MNSDTNNVFSNHVIGLHLSEDLLLEV